MSCVGLLFELLFAGFVRSLVHDAGDLDRRGTTFWEVKAETARSTQKESEEAARQSKSHTLPPKIGDFALNDKKFGKGGYDRPSHLYLQFSATTTTSRKGCRSIWGSHTRNPGALVCDDGSFIVSGGFVSMFTRKACWEETSDTGVRRFVTGQFDQEFLSFSGEWLASDGTRGTLVNNPDSAPLLAFATPMDEEPGKLLPGEEDRVGMPVAEPVLMHPALAGAIHR